jgi:purine-nucleoside phosphorylase
MLSPVIIPAANATLILLVIANDASKLERQRETEQHPILFSQRPTMTQLYEQASAAAAHVRMLTPHTPRVGIILGSGLGGFGSQVEDATIIAYSSIPNFPQSTVEGHHGNLILGTVAGVPVAVMQGRVHAYEGYPLHEVTFPTRVLGLLGCRTLVVTNAAGGINARYKPGALVAITDHINLTGTNAALGPNEPRFAVRPVAGLRFFDMSTAYSPALLAIAHSEAAKLEIPLDEGVYLAVLGPSFETPAEIRAFRTLGADLVGMSTVHEVIVARHMGIEVLGLSLVTNFAAGVTTDKINHEEVMEIGRLAEARFTSLIKAVLPQL